MVLLGVTILGTFLGTVAAVEARAWALHVSRWLLRGTVARFPAGLAATTRARWTEEIEADLASFTDRPLTGVLFALRLRLRGGSDLAAQLALDQAMADVVPPAGADGGKPAPPPAIVIDTNVWTELLRGHLESRLEAFVIRQISTERRRVLAHVMALVCNDPRVRAQVSGSPAMQRQLVRALVEILIEEER